MDKNLDKIAMDFWGRVDNKLKETNLNLKYICQKNGMHYQTMLNQKSTAHVPSVVNAVNLAKELGCSVEWLIYGDCEKSSLKNADDLAQRMYNDRRLYSVVKYLSLATQEELYALEVLLKIRINS